MRCASTRLVPLTTTILPRIWTIILYLRRIHVPFQLGERSLEFSTL